MPCNSDPSAVIRRERRAPFQTTGLIRPIGRDSHLDSVSTFNQQSATVSTDRSKPGLSQVVPREHYLLIAT